MALFKPFMGNRTSLDAQPLHNGYAYFCTDDGSFHIDYVDTEGNLQRKQINAKDAETLMGMSLDKIIVQSDYSQTDSTQPNYIKNKLGDLVAIENTIELLNVSALPTAEEAGEGIYDTYFKHQLIQPTIGDVVQVEIKLLNSENSIIFNNIEVLNHDEGDPLIIVNTNQTDIYTAIEEGLVKIDDSLPAFFLCLYDNEIDLISWEDYTGASIVISKTETINDYIKLPNEALAFDSKPIENSENLMTSGAIYNALQNISGDSNNTTYTAGDFIEIKDGVISSTLGKEKAVVVKEDLFVCNSVAEGGLNGNTYAYYDYGIQSFIKIGDLVNVDFVVSKTSEPITYTDIEVVEYSGMPMVIINSHIKDLDTILDNGFTKIDNDSIAFALLTFSQGNDDEMEYVYNIVSSEDCVGASVRVYKEVEIESHIKLPNEALTFDDVPIDGSEHLITSGGVYNALQNIGGTSGGTLVQIITWEEND